MVDQADKRAAAVAWAKRGFRVFPLRAGSKHPVDKAWFAVASNDVETVTQMWTDPVMGWPRDYNIGVLTDDMIVVDVDMKSGKNGLQSFLALGLPLDSLTVRTPSGGFHVYFSGPSRSLSVGRLGSGLDIRSYHGFAIAPGSVLTEAECRGGDVAGVYALAADLPVRAAPGHLLALLDAPLERADQLPVIDLDQPANLERARVYLDQEAALAVEGDGGDNTTFLVALHLKDIGLSEEAAFSALCDYWNERCSPPWDTDELRQKVANAYRYGKLPPGASDAALDFEGVDTTPFVPPAPPVLSGPGWYHHGDPWDSEEAWLLEDTLPQTGVALLFGPSGAGKTFLALDLAAALAMRRPFFGITPEERGATLYLTSESLRSVKTRMAALDPGGRLPIVARYVSGLHDKTVLQALLDEVAAEARRLMDAHQVPPRMVVLDTLSASNLLLDENDNAEAAAAIACLARASQNLRMLFLVVHHPDKDGRQARGAGALKNSADYVLRADREGKAAIRSLILEKARDALERELGNYTLPEVEVGRTKKGKVVKTMVVSTTTERPQADKGESGGNFLELFMSCLDFALIEDGTTVEGQEAVEVEAVESIFEERKPGVRNRRTVRAAFKSALANAQENGLVDHFVSAGRKYLQRRVLQ